ncbi:MAG: TetR-like C-terminal domain-containing protein [Pseudonocardiaceae bacterium]
MSSNRGRPRDTSLDAAIATATESVLLTDGYAAVSIDRVAKLAETTRTAVYRRVKNRGELVVGLLVQRFGVDPAPDTGDLRRDLRLVQELQLAFFTDPVVEAGLAGVLSDIRADPALGTVVHERFIAPRRRSVAAMLSRAADRGEIAPIDDPARISDILTGPLLLRATIPAIGPIDNTLIETTIKAALALCN